MKKILFGVLILLFGCNQKNANTYQILLQPGTPVVKHYKSEQIIQVFATKNGQEQNTYVKQMNDYSFTYSAADSNINIDIAFNEFRLEYEDGEGVQVFDTRFDKPDFTSFDSRIFFIMKNKKISSLITKNGTILQVKGIATLKNQIIKEYAQVGLDKNVLNAVLDSFLLRFIKNHVLEENLLFYTKQPVVKDSSYRVSAVSKAPLVFHMDISYIIKSENEKEKILSGKGYGILKDSTIINNPNYILAPYKKRAEIFDEVQLDAKTGLLNYRKLYLNYADSLLENKKPFPMRIVIEKEWKEKKPG